MMTDNEIIKAVECCIGNTKCGECPMFRTPNCMNRVFGYAFNLINRQKAEIENLKDILYDTEGVNLVNYWHQQCKIVENGCRNFDEENKNLKAEIERYKSGMMANAEVVKTVTTELKKAKSEAIKEFAERLKEKLNNLEYHTDTNRKTVTKAHLYDVVNWVMHEVVPDEINNLVKEMTEVSE